MVTKIGQLPSREEAQKIAQICPYLGKVCPLCFVNGQDEPSVCCAFCTKYGIPDCDCGSPTCEWLERR